MNSIEGCSDLVQGVVAELEELCKMGEITERAERILPRRTSQSRAEPSYVGNMLAPRSVQVVVSPGFRI